MLEPAGLSTRIGVLGGSFDPVHMGHLIIAQDAIERLELSKLILIPAAIPPHKQMARQVDGEHRFNMLSLAVESDIRMTVSDIELQRGGVSYTLDTLKAVRRAEPDAELFMIIGSDTLAELHTWHEPEAILSLCEIATLMRPGEDCLDTLSEKVAFEHPHKDRLLEHLIEAHPVDISSTEIRMRIAEGLSIRYLVPPEVEMYIFEHGLYQG